MEITEQEKIVESNPAVEQQSPVEKVNILLVDDEPRNLDALEVVLTTPELRLIRAQSAEQALLALTQGEFACLILDIQMPGMNGLDLARLIKTRKRNEHIPIIFLTAYFLEEKDALQGYGAGAVDYLTKPINSRILRSKVGVFVNLFRATHALTALNNALESEIVQRKKAEDALREVNVELESRVRQRTVELSLSEKRYRQVVSNLPVAIYTTDAEGRITLFNEAAVELWKRRPEIGCDCWCGSYKIFRPDGSHMPLEECPMAITLKTGVPVRGEEILVECPDGSRKNVLPYPTPILDDAGKITGAVNMLLDITERNLARLVTQRFAAIVESSDDAIIGKDVNGIIQSWNVGAERIFQYKAEEIIGKPIMTLIPDERKKEETEILKKVRDGQRIKHFETLRCRKDRKLIDVALTISPIKDGAGKVIGASKIARDITERKHAEECQRLLYELVAGVNRTDNLDEIYNMALDAVVKCHHADRAAILISDDGGVMRFKASSGLSLEYRAAAEGHSPWKRNGNGAPPAPVFITDVAATELDESLRAAVEKEGIRALAFIPIVYEKNLLGKFMIYYNTPHPFTLDEVRPAQTVASQIAFAIERKRAETALKHAHDEILAASRAKDDFIATLSHELRTPLNPVLLLASEAVNNHELPPRVRSDFNTIRKNIELEARLIDDLLDLTRIERGKITIEKHFINLRNVLQDAVAQVREDVKQKQIALEMNLKAAQHTVFGDAVRLQQIFWNLVKNAVKFTPRGGKITVETGLAGNKLLVKVTDTGIGMTHEEMAGIFSAFSQGEHASNGNRHRFGGLGLGLVISQKLAEFHSGKIIAASEGRDKGSTFTVELPLASETNGVAVAPRPPAETPSAAPSKGVRVLLVEDHEPTRTTLAYLLARRSYKVSTAGSVAEARALAGMESFDLLISDIGLPDGNGYELMTELGKKSSIRGIALTGYGMDHDLERSENAGFAAHLTKPVRIQSLEAALDAATKLSQTA